MAEPFFFFSPSEEEPAAPAAAAAATLAATAAEAEAEAEAANVFEDSRSALNCRTDPFFGLNPVPPLRVLHCWCCLDDGLQVDGFT